MKCFVCNYEDPFITYDPVKDEFPPCSECLSIVQDTLAEFGDDDDGEESESIY